MSRFFTLFLAVLAVGSFGGLAWMMAQPVPSDPRVSKLETENRDLKEEVERLRGQVKKQASQDLALSKTAVPTAGSPAGGSPSFEVVQTPNKLSSGSEAQPKAQSAAVKTLMDNMSANQIDMGYSKLMVLLGLNDEEKAHFKKLLVEREKSQSASLRNIGNKNSTPEERKKASADRASQLKAYDDAIKAFLNDAGDYQTFKQWEDTRPERTQFELTGRSLFEASSEPLSDQQESQLINLIATARKAPTAPKLPLTSKLDPVTAGATIDTWVQQTAQMHQGIQASAAGTLTPGQLQILGGYLAQSRDSMARSLRMMVQRTSTSP